MRHRISIPTHIIVMDWVGRSTADFCDKRPCFWGAARNPPPPPPAPAPQRFKYAAGAHKPNAMRLCTGAEHRIRETARLLRDLVGLDGFWVGGESEVGEVGLVGLLP